MLTQDWEEVRKYHVCVCVCVYMDNICVCMYNFKKEDQNPSQQFQSIFYQSKLVYIIKWQSPVSKNQKLNKIKEQ